MIPGVHREWRPVVRVRRNDLLEHHVNARHIEAFRVIQAIPRSDGVCLWLENGDGVPVSRLLSRNAIVGVYVADPTPPPARLLDPPEYAAYKTARRIIGIGRSKENAR